MHKNDSKRHTGISEASFPPDYIKLPPAIACADVEDGVIVTMARILGLCWTFKYKKTSPLLPEQLAKLVGRSRATLYRHLNRVQELGWLKVERRGGRLVLRPLIRVTSERGASGGDVRAAPGRTTSEAPAEYRFRGGAKSHASQVPFGEGMQSLRPSPRRGCRLRGGGKPTDAYGFQAGDVREPQSSDGRTKQPGDKQQLGEALKGAGIIGRAFHDLIQMNIDPITVCAWHLWTWAPEQGWMDNPSGFIITRLRDGDEPPGEFLEIARLTPDEVAMLGDAWSSSEKYSGWPSLNARLRKLAPLWADLHEAMRLKT